MPAPCGVYGQTCRFELGYKGHAVWGSSLWVPGCVVTGHPAWLVVLGLALHGFGSCVLLAHIANHFATPLIFRLIQFSLQGVTLNSAIVRVWSVENVSSKKTWVMWGYVTSCWGGSAGLLQAGMAWSCMWANRWDCECGAQKLRLYWSQAFNTVIWPKLEVYMWR